MATTKLQDAERIWYCVTVLNGVTDDMKFILENKKLFLDGEARVTLNRRLKDLSALKSKLEKELTKPLFDPNEKPFYKS